MTGNIVKIIACITMLFDHMGILLFPNIIVFRYIGRIAMPLYAYMIAEGALHTKNKLKYFLQIFLLGIFCQSVYLIEELLSFGVHSLYLNILITFSFSLIMIFPFIKARENFEKGDKSKSIKYFALFILALIFTVAFEVYSRNSYTLTNFSVKTDYGLLGTLLPLSAVMFKDKRNRLLSFTLCLIAFNLYLMNNMYYTWFSLISLFVLILYNGKRGRKRYKYAFYLFYPLHLAGIYLIASFM